MKKCISLLLVILTIFGLSACTKSGVSVKSSPESVDKPSESSSEIENDLFELTDRNYNDLSEDEKEQLMYYNDGYTFIANILDYSDEYWYIYKYGKLFKVIDITNFVNNEQQKYEEVHIDDNTIKNYVVIDNYLYFFISETKDVYRINFENPTVEKYIDGKEFEEYAIYNNSVMLKHNDNLLFLCTCKDWNNVIEVDTTVENPELKYMGKTESIIDPGDKWEKFNFIPIDTNNYRITDFGDNVATDSLTDFYNYNFSLTDYKITDIRQFPSIEFDEEHWQNYVEENSIGYFFRDDKELLYSYINTEYENDINGTSEFRSSILKSDSDSNKDFLCKDVPHFNIDNDSDDFKMYLLYNSKLSNDWLYFNTDKYDLIYFFDEKILCETKDCSAKYVDLWNVYYETNKDNHLIYESKPIEDFKDNIFQGSTE